MIDLFVITLVSINLLQGTQLAEASTNPKSDDVQMISSSRRLKNSLHIKRKSFLWKASLDRDTGVASSYERSIFNIFGGNEIILGQNTNKGQKEFVWNQFSKYPHFLQKSSLTLGLCRTVPSTSHDECFNLQTSFLPLNMLTFGKPRMVVSPKKMNSARNNVKDGPFGDIVCCVEIPIVGGMLAKVFDEEQQKSLKSTPNKSNENDHGCLRFTWFSTNYSDHHQGQQPDNIVLVTEIAGNYQPSLAGNRIPIPEWRNIMYCSTQRLLHTYVMWRFHGFVVKEYQRNAFEV